jgi:hypothetical protein
VKYCGIVCHSCEHCRVARRQSLQLLPPPVSSRLLLLLLLTETAAA